MSNLGAHPCEGVPFLIHLKKKGRRTMFIILAYDVSSTRGQKVMKTCRKYLHHVQKSVFEGVITEAKLKQLQQELKKIMILDRDKLCIYCMDSVKYASKIQIGPVEDLDIFL